MGMPADHLRRNRVHHIAKREPIILGGHLRVIDDLQEQVAELVLQAVEILTRNRVSNLVSFLDGVGHDGREALLQVPRTSGLGVAQARHNREKVVDRVALSGVVTHHKPAFAELRRQPKLGGKYPANPTR